MSDLGLNVDAPEHERLNNKLVCLTAPAVMQSESVTKHGNAF